MNSPQSHDPQGRVLVSYDTLLAMVLREQTRRELEVLPGPEELERFYPDTTHWDKRLRRALRARRKPRLTVQPRRVTLRRLVLVMAVLVLLMACALATSAEVRYAVRQAVLQWSDRELRLTYETEGSPDPATLTLPEGFADHYVPDGFVLNQDNKLEMADFYFHAYYDSTNPYYTYTVTCYVVQPTGQVETFDNEHTVYETIDLSGQEAVLGTSSNSDGSTSYYLFWDADNVHYTVHGNLSLDSIMKIASNIS